MTHSERQLERESPLPGAACAGDQYPLTGEVTALAQRPQRRRARHRERGGGNEAYLIRQDGETVGRNGDTFGPAGLVDQSHDAGALGWPGAIGCPALHDPDIVLTRSRASRAEGSRNRASS